MPRSDIIGLEDRPALNEAPPGADRDPARLRSTSCGGRPAIQRKFQAKSSPDARSADPPS